jgi:hypothetical protein
MKFREYVSIREKFKVYRGRSKVEERFDSLDKYYKPIEKLKLFSNALFLTNVLLSIIVFFIEKHLIVKNIILGVYIITTILYFIIDNYLSIFLIPKVEEKRRLHLLTNSFGIPLDNEKTNKYYNNSLEPSFLKLGANILENSFFSKRVTSELLAIERIKILIYAVIWTVYLLVRTNDLEFISIISQTLFASTIVPSWLRLEVLQKQNEKIYSRLYDFFSYS